MADEKLDEIYVGCMSVQMGKWNPDNIVPGSIVKICGKCNKEVYASIGTQNLLAEKSIPVHLICIECLRKKNQEALNNKEEVKFMGVVPTDVNELKAELSKVLEKKDGSNQPDAIK